MKKTIILTIAILSLWACGPNQESQLEEIRTFEKSDKIGTDEGLKELAKMHKTYGMKYNDAEANNYLYAAAQYYFYEQNMEEAKELLNAYISRDDTSDRFQNAALNIAILYSKEKNYGAADDLVSEVLDQHLPTAAQWQEVITIYQNKIATGTNITPQNYEKLAMAYTAVGRFEEATQSLDSAITRFMDYPERANLIYRAGFIGWEYLKDIDVAKRYYNQFLEEYPNDEKASEVKQILTSGMLEMSDEDILNMLKGKAQ